MAASFAGQACWIAFDPLIVIFTLLEQYLSQPESEGSIFSQACRLAWRSPIGSVSSTAAMAPYRFLAPPASTIVNNNEPSAGTEHKEQLRNSRLIIIRLPAACDFLSLSLALPVDVRACMAVRRAVSLCSARAFRRQSGGRAGAVNTDASFPRCRPIGATKPLLLILSIRRSRKSIRLFFGPTDDRRQIRPRRRRIGSRVDKASLDLARAGGCVAQAARFVGSALATDCCSP